MTESIELEGIKSQVKQVLGELLEVARLKPGQILVVGCSSNEIDNFKIDSYPNGDIGMVVFPVLNEELKSLGMFLVTQCCEHSNHVLILEGEAAKHYGYRTVNTVPQLRTDGSFATVACAVLEHPVAAEHIKAHAGIDIGDTLIGIHLGDAAVPVCVQTREIGNAHVVRARTRPRFIDGVRACYDEEHMQHQPVKREEVPFMNRAIMINRQYSSGGCELGEKLAMKLGVLFYDKELIAVVTKEDNIGPSASKTNDEVEPDLDNYSTHLIEPGRQIVVTRRIYAVQGTVIKSLAEKGSCIITGHCADTILPHAVSTLVFVDIESRIKRVMSLNPELPGDGAEGGVSIVGRGRKAYHEYYPPIEWGGMEVHDTCLSSGLIGMDRRLDVALVHINHVKQNV